MDKSTEVLSRYASEFRFSDLPAPVVHETKRKLIDTLGCALGAFHSEPARIARAVASRSTGNPPARILGTRVSSTPDQAAFANGAMVRFLDFNDSYLAQASCHPSDTLPAVLAMADALHANGEAVITATALAYDVACNFADVLPREQGWDNTLFDLIGSAVGCGKLLELDAARVAQAIALAIVPNLPLAQTRLGELSMWKGCAAANAARNGVYAALLAKEGMTGPDQPIEGRWGLWRTHGKFTWAPFGGQGGPYRIAQTHLKYFPAVVHAQSPISAALESYPRIRVDDIESVVIDTYWVAKRYADKASPLWHPMTAETADHSIVYLVAAALLDGDISAASFSDERIRDPRLHALLHRISIRENAQFSAAYPAGWPCRIEIITKSGAQLVNETQFFKGHVKKPLTDNEVETKFRALTSDLLESHQVDAVLAKLWRLDEVQDIGEVLELLVAGPTDIGRG